MHCRHHACRDWRYQDLAALARDAEGWAENGLRGGRSETNEDAWPNESQFRFQPWPAGRDLARVWLFVNAAFPARLPFEVLHCVSEVNFVAVDPGFFERAIEQLSGRSDERFSAQVFL